MSDRRIDSGSSGPFTCEALVDVAFGNRARRRRIEKRFLVSRENDTRRLASGSRSGIHIERSEGVRRALCLNLASDGRESVRNLREYGGEEDISLPFVVRVRENKCRGIARSELGFARLRQETRD